MQKENQQTVNENSLHLLFRLLFFAPSLSSSNCVFSRQLSRRRLLLARSPLQRQR